MNADPLAKGLAGFNAEAMALKAGRIMMARLHELASERRTFAFESTLAGKTYVRLLKKLREEEYKVQLMFLWLRSPELAIERVRSPRKSVGILFLKK